MQIDAEKLLQYLGEQLTVHKALAESMENQIFAPDTISDEREAKLRQFHQSAGGHPRAE